MANKRSLDDLLKEMEDIRKEIEKQSEERLSEIKSELQQIAEARRTTLNKLVEAEILDKPTITTATTRNAKSGKADARYAHPENPSLTWTGRGRRPNWLTELVDAGNEITDYEIKKSYTSKSSERSSKNNDADRAEEGDNAET